MTDRERALLTDRVWQAWNALPAHTPAPAKLIASRLHMEPSEVAAIVYPPTTFGPWDDSQEPDL